MNIILESGRILTPLAEVNDGVVIVNEEGRITYCGKRVNAPLTEGKHINLKGRIIAPGFIDIHVHGGYGVA